MGKTMGKSKKQVKKSKAYVPRAMTRRPRGRTSGVPEWASCSEKITLDYASATGANKAFSFNQVYNMYNTSLLSTNRAAVIAQGYQYFRIKKIRLQFKPEVEDYVPGSAMPYLYFQIDRAGQCINYGNANQFRALGCKAHRFDKVYTIEFKPGVLQGVLDNQPSGSTPFAKPLLSPWLATNQNNYISGPTGVWQPSEVDHTGIAWMVECRSAAGVALPNIFYHVDVEIELEFKKPLQQVIGSSESDPPPLSVHIKPTDEPQSELLKRVVS